MVCATHYHFVDDLYQHSWYVACSSARPSCEGLTTVQVGTVDERRYEANTKTQFQMDLSIPFEAH